MKQNRIQKMVAVTKRKMLNRQSKMKGILRFPLIQAHWLVNKPFIRSSEETFTQPPGRAYHIPQVYKAKKEDAKRMLEKGFDMHTIMEITGLMEKEIQELKEK